MLPKPEDVPPTLKICIMLMVLPAYQIKAAGTKSFPAGGPSNNQRNQLVRKTGPSRTVIRWSLFASKLTAEETSRDIISYFQSAE